MNATASKHTPTPWRIEHGDEEHREGIWAHNPVIGNDTWIAGTMMQADLPFIVQAVNAHDELVAALEGMLEWARRVTQRNPGPEIVNACNALSKARGD